MGICSSTLVMELKALLDPRKLFRWVILIYSKYSNDHLIYNEYFLVEVDVVLCASLPQSMLPGKTKGQGFLWASKFEK